ncbi:hypothetical protein LPJ66_004582 [Kickxella alabastrina]|uniref:Uncharacterized protein n=1 Tax=Kickxella alabastrina TaxID=61397 RepID=A0ACC1IJ90_9FUNG|nr:hypothetical protein LPJ66_004582 [Kickxella alabastrina]
MLSSPSPLPQVSSCTVIPAESRFNIQQATYAIDPLTCAATRLSDATAQSTTNTSTFINTLVMTHGKTGMVWTWAQLSSTPLVKSNSGTLSNLVLAMPPRPPARASASQIIGGNADDPTADIGRRLTARFKRPVFVSLHGVGSNMAMRGAGSGGMMSLDAMALSLSDEMAAVERCVLAELKQALAENV